MSSVSPNERKSRLRSIGKDSSVDRMSQRTQGDIQEISEIISSCNFLCDKFIEEDQTENMSKKLDRHLTRREKFIYEGILAECGTSGDFKRLQASLIILQKLIRRKREKKLAKQAEKEAQMKDSNNFLASVSNPGKKRASKSTVTLRKELMREPGFMDYEDLHK
eukprot:CAMPEP_0185589284 /NCGR_PEP_ID=MMETSP0434-20130131/56372_1 /TAXON_ID=626734 ORGANISM="Favella taraikaensis, Strain Fe Narragansett Bay" /NCGR_SAMPLE_ID=MMETSP0434 /ASSEMBLY_ACC=CAM_ASM_000379 /LENGTH=163 /DNA_ID=CAMNT_0028212547 /DNA_START=1302 /DNA_END=1793 /DNA_ORIENTATION=-